MHTENSFVVLAEGEMVREKTAVVADSIVGQDARIEHLCDRVADVVAHEKGGTVGIHVGSNDVYKKGSEEVMGVSAGDEEGAGWTDCTLRDPTCSWCVGL